MVKFLPTCAETLEGKYYNNLYSFGGGGGGGCCINTTVFPLFGGCQNGTAGNALTRGGGGGYSTVQSRSQGGRSTMVALCMQQPF